MKASDIRVDGLNDRESRRLIIKICEQMKVKWWLDNEGKMVIDLDHSLELGD